MAKCNVAKFETMHTFLSEHQFEIDKNVPDKLRCEICKKILRNPYQGSCLCKFCLSCINEMLRNGTDQCPGSKDECKEEPLSQFVAHHSTNFKISKLILKCPNELCQYECELMKMDGHFSLCSMGSVTCPVFGLRSNGDKFMTDKMADPLHPDEHNRDKILIEMIGDLRKELKQSDERNQDELQRNKRQITMLTENSRIKDKAISVIQEEIQKTKDQLKDFTENSRMKDETIAEMQVKIRSLKVKNQQIATETDQLRMGLEHEITNLREEMSKELRDNLKKKGTEIDGRIVEYQLQSASRTDRVDRRQKIPIEPTFSWRVDEISDKRWRSVNIYSEIFYPETSPYKMQLAILNGATRDQLDIQFCIHPGENDARLEWPFQRNVSIQIANKAQVISSKRIKKYCNIPKPNNNSSKCSALFKFLYLGLTNLGLMQDNYFDIQCHVE